MHFGRRQHTSFSCRCWKSKAMMTTRSRMNQRWKKHLRAMVQSSRHLHDKYTRVQTVAAFFFSGNHDICARAYADCVPPGHWPSGPEGFVARRSSRRAQRQLSNFGEASRRVRHHDVHLNLTAHQNTRTTFVNELGMTLV